MSRRTGDRSLVGYHSDPVPADWSDVDGVASDYRKRADDLALAHATLSNLSELNGWTSEAAAEFAESAHDGLGDLAKARDKYDGAADALEAFADAVSTARTDTWNGLPAAEEAEQTRRANDADNLSGLSEPTQQQVDDQSACDTSASQARTCAGNDVQAAVAALEQAARTAAEKIESASESYDDGWFDDFKGWVREHADILRLIVDILEWVAVALAVIGFFLGGWVFLVIAIAVAAAILLIDAMLVSAGEEEWSKLIWDTVGLALTAVGGTAALKLAGKMSRVFKSGMDDVVADVAAASRNSLGPMITNALGRSATNPIRWLGEGAAWLNKVSAVSRFRMNNFFTMPSLRSVLQAGNFGTARQLARFEHLARVGQVDSLAAGMAGLARGSRIPDWAMTVQGLDDLTSKTTGLLPGDNSISIGDFTEGQFDGLLGPNTQGLSQDQVDGVIDIAMPEIGDLLDGWHAGRRTVGHPR